MKKMLLILVVCFSAFTFCKQVLATPISSSSDVALNGSTIINFNSQVIGVYNILSIGDVTFSADPSTLRIQSTYAGQFNTTGLYLDNNSNGFGSLTIDFTTSVNAFGFNFGASNTNWTLTAYDTHDNVLESTIIAETTGSNAGDFFGLATAGTSYAVLEMTGSYNYGGNDWILMDNFSYNTQAAPVPEPATMVLLGLGLVGLAGIGRKKLQK